MPQQEARFEYKIMYIQVLGQGCAQNQSNPRVAPFTPTTPERYPCAKRPYPIPKKCSNAQTAVPPRGRIPEKHKLPWAPSSCPETLRSTPLVPRCQFSPQTYNPSGQCGPTDCGPRRTTNTSASSRSRRPPSRRGRHGYWGPSCRGPCPRHRPPSRPRRRRRHHPRPAAASAA